MKTIIFSLLLSAVQDAQVEKKTSQVGGEIGGVCFFSFLPTSFYGDVKIGKKFGNTGIELGVGSVGIPYYSIITLMIEGVVTVRITKGDVFSHLIEAGLEYYKTLLNTQGEEERGKGIGIKIAYVREHIFLSDWRHGIKIGFRWSDKVYGTAGGFGFPILGVNIALSLSKRLN